MKKIVGIVGTNTKVSTNRMLLEYIESQFFYKVEVELIEIKDVPIFDSQSEEEAPEIVNKIAKKIEESDGVIISTAEYDHGPTAALLNMLSWLSFKIHPLSRKPLMLIGAAYGFLGSRRAQTALRQILSAPEINARVLSSEFLLGYSNTAFDEIGDLINREKIQEMEIIFDEFLDFIEVVNYSNNKDLMNIHDFDNFKWDTLEGDE